MKIVKKQRSLIIFFLFSYQISTGFWVEERIVENPVGLSLFYFVLLWEQRELACELDVSVECKTECGREGCRNSTVTERGPSVHDEGQIGPSILLKRESSSWNDVIAPFT